MAQPQHGKSAKQRLSWDLVVSQSLRHSAIMKDLKYLKLLHCHYQHLQRFLVTSCDLLISFDNMSWLFLMSLETPGWKWWLASAVNCFISSAFFPDRRGREVSKGSLPMGGGQHFPCVDSPSHFDHFISLYNCIMRHPILGPPISTVQTTVSTLYCFQEAQRIWMQLVRPSMRHSQHQIILCGHPSLDELRTSHQISHQKHAGPWASNPPVSSPFQIFPVQPWSKAGAHPILWQPRLVRCRAFPQSLGLSQGLQDTGKLNTRRKDCCNAAHISAVFIL